MEQQSISSDLIRGHIDTIILHTLLDGDKFAEQISETIEIKSENAYKINQATLYSALKRLQNIKLLNSYQKDIENGAGRRKFFTLTEKGRETVDQNLSSWSYSRAIIDKLIDCEPQPVYKTEYVEKLVQIPVEKVIYKEVPVVENKETSSPNNIQDKCNETINVSQSGPQTVVQQESVQEINFRNIINGLIETCNIAQKSETIVEIEAIRREDVGEIEDIQSLHDTITENARPLKRQDLETIDFSDLMLKATEEGYKLRVSNKNTFAKAGNLLINKLNLFTSLAMFLLVLLEILVISSASRKLLNMNIVLSLALIALASIYPIICIVKYLKNQFLTTSKSVPKDTILTSAIIVFNLLVINFACLFLSGMDFSVKKDVLLFLIIPIVLYADFFIYSVIRYFFAHHKVCKIVKN